MKKYRIVVPKKVSKQIQGVPLIHKKKIRKAIAFLSINPFLGKKLGGKLKDKRSVRIWPYRIIYKVYKKEVTVLIVSVAHRGGAY